MSTVAESVVLDDAASIPLPRSPRTHITSDPISTDSLVTVRLSEPSVIANLSGDETGSTSAESDTTIHPTHVRARSSLEIMAGRALDAELAIQSIETPVEEEDFASRHSREHLSISTVHAEDAFGEFGDLQKPRRRSDSSEDSLEGEQVDWVELDRTEEAEPRNEESDESTAFLLARLEQENNALASDHRFGLGKDRNRKKQSRPPSIHVLKRLVNDPNGVSTRYSLLPNPPPMTELEFWAALVKDYAQTALRLPTLTSNKIKSGVPPPLRGVVWMSMVGARDRDLAETFDKLVQESSPYETIIGKDIGRSFPGVEMFKEAGGEGQLMLGRVLKAFSLYDKDIGYCQGLGFLVGPLLMQMGDKDAFCVLVRLMESFDLRSCFLPDLSGLHLRIYQFQRLLEEHLPTLAQHLKDLQVEAAYLSQWFLSFFAVTCPLPMLFRVYDVILAEGASETIMRVAMSLMKRNEEKLLAHQEFEEAIQLLLSRNLWEPYQCDADDLVNDFMGMTGLVTRDTLQKLEQQFKLQTHANSAGVARAGFLPDVTAAASNFLGRLWTTGGKSSLSVNPGPPQSHSRSPSGLRRSASKQSIASTIRSTDISSEGTGSVGTVTTDATAMSRDSSGDMLSIRSKPGSMAPGITVVSKEDKDLHSQIEDLLTALSEMQRDQALLAAQLQKEREERHEDHTLFRDLVDRIKSRPQDAGPDDRRRTLASPEQYTPQLSPESRALSDHLGDIVDRVDDRLLEQQNYRRSSMLETKQRLRESLVRSKDQLGTEMSRSAEMSRRLDEKEKENAEIREELRQARNRLQEGFADRQRLEKSVQDFRRQSLAWTDLEARASPRRTDTEGSRLSNSSNGSPVGNGHTSSGGLRELKLAARRDSTSPVTKGPSPLGTATAHPARGSSLATKEILATRDHAPASEESLLLELVNAKTAEAVARQELEELKGRMESMRKMLNLPAGHSPLSTHPPPASSFASTLASTSVSFFHRASPSETGSAQTAAGTAVEAPRPKSSTNNQDESKLNPTASGGFWASWGKRSFSSGSAAPTVSGTPEKTL